MDDQQLIRRIVKRRDANAANDLVSRYYDEIHRFALRQSIGIRKMTDGHMRSGLCSCKAAPD